MANNFSSAAHWCKDVVEESTKYNPLAAPALPGSTSANTHTTTAPYQQQQAVYTNQDSYYQQYYNSIGGSYQNPTSNSGEATYDDYYRQYYEQYRRYNQQQQSNNVSYASSNTAPSHSHISSQANSYQPTPMTYAGALSQGLSASTSIPQYNSVNTPSVTSWQTPRPPPAVVVAAQARTQTHPSVETSSQTQTTSYVKKPSRFSSKPQGSGTTNGSGALQSKPHEQNNNFPPSLRAFVERAFASCHTDSDRTFIQDYLKDIIGKVSKDGRLNKHRWDLESVPRLDLVNSTPQYEGHDTQPQQIDRKNNDSTTSTETRKRKSRFSLDANKANSAIDYNYSPNNIIDSKRTKVGIYGPGTSVNSSDNNHSTPTSGTGVYGPSSIENKDTLLRQKRASRFSKQDASGVNANVKKKGQKKTKPSNFVPTPSVPLTEEDLENMKVVGTCQKLEKDYFRLTSPPDPNTVRPQHILRQALDFVKNKWLAEKNTNKEINSYILSQFKSIRQDLTLQHISNDLTVKAYETHARIALEIGDLNEYNQCQTQLKQLYASGLVGSDKEFTAYRILYYLYLRGNKKYQSGSQDLLHIMSSLTEDSQRHPSVAHALGVRQALLQDNYHKFFVLYQSTPDLGNCILDLMSVSYRFKYLQRMFKAYNPSIERSFVIQELGFSDHNSGVDYLKSVGCIYTEGAGEQSMRPLLDTKNSILTPPKDESGLLL